MGVSVVHGGSRRGQASWSFTHTAIAGVLGPGAGGAALVEHKKADTNYLIKQNGSLGNEGKLKTGSSDAYRR